MLRQKIVIDGKRVSTSKFEIMLQDGLDNIILGGFFSIDDLEKSVNVNGHYSAYMIDKLLDRLYNTYSNNLISNRRKAPYDKAYASNVIMISEKLEIILDLIEKRAQDSIKTIMDNESEYYDYDKLDEDDFDDEPTYTMSVSSKIKAM